MVASIKNGYTREIVTYVYPLVLLRSYKKTSAAVNNGHRIAYLSFSILKA